MGKKRGATHTSVQQGKRVFIRLTNGSLFVAKFKAKRARHIEFFDHQNTSIKDIVTLGINRGQSSH